MPWLIERDGDVAVVHMNSHPANVQNARFFADLHAAFDRLEAEFPDCAVVLTGSGRCFSAGLDFEESFAQLAPPASSEIGAWFERYRATNLRVFTYPRPIVAAMNGHAFAGGLITALDCDYRVCSSAARLGLNEVPIGIPMPAAYVEIIRYAAGSRAASVATLFGREYRADEARDLGLVHAVVPPEAVMAEAMAMARAVSPDAFGAFAFSKRALQAPTLERIHGAAQLDDAALGALVSAPANVMARARRYEQIKGCRPPWAP